MATNIKRFQKEVENLLHVMRVDYTSLSLSHYNSMGELIQDLEGFKQFELARNFFENSFGWEMARANNYIFMVRKVEKGVIYIEVEVA